MCGLDYSLNMATKIQLSSKNRQSILVLRNEGYSNVRNCHESKDLIQWRVPLPSSKLAPTTIEGEAGGPRCTTEQDDKYITVWSLRQFH